MTAPREWARRRTPGVGAGVVTAFGAVTTLSVAGEPLRVGLGLLGTLGLALAVTVGSRPALLTGTATLFAPVALAAVDGGSLGVLAGTAAGILAYTAADRALTRRDRGVRTDRSRVELVRAGVGLCVAALSVVVVYGLSAVATELPTGLTVPALLVGIAVVAWLVVSR